jgi:mannose-1-phosphate guanylyltransferase
LGQALLRITGISDLRHSLWGGREGSFVEKETSFYFPTVDVTQNGVHLNDDEVFCGIVLAGGEGKRLQPFIKSLGRGALPKQYVNFIGRRSMLEHTFHRAGKLVSSERLLTVITESHLRHPEVREQCSVRPRDTLIVQPENKETGPGLMLPLMYLYKRYPNSLALVLPSDHFIWQEDRLVDHARLACLAVKQDPSRMILLGIKPDRAEPEYGYLLPNKKQSGIGPNMSEISWFIEKPDQKTARRLIRAGGLWNTMIMVFKTKTMLHWLSKLAPTVYQQFQQVYEAIGTAGETEVVRNIYQRLKPMNFSKEFIEPMVKNYPSNLIALPIRDLLWSDWGTASRVLDVLRKTGTIAHLNSFRNTTGKGATSHRLRTSLWFDRDFQNQRIFAQSNGFAASEAIYKETPGISTNGNTRVSSK